MVWLKSGGERFIDDGCGGLGIFFCKTSRRLGRHNVQCIVFLTGARIQAIDRDRGLFFLGFCGSYGIITSFLGSNTNLFSIRHSTGTREILNNMSTIYTYNNQKNTTYNSVLFSVSRTIPVYVAHRLQCWQPNAINCPTNRLHRSQMRLSERDFIRGRKALVISRPYHRPSRMLPVIRC